MRLSPIASQAGLLSHMRLSLIAYQVQPQSFWHMGFSIIPGCICTCMWITSVQL